MVKLKGLLEGNTIKACYKEVTVRDLRTIKKNAPLDIIAALSDIPIATLLKLGTDDILSLYELVSFVSDIEDAFLYVPENIRIPLVDVGSESFEKCELAKNKAIEIKEYFMLFPELVRIYLGEKHLKGSAVVCLAKGAVILEALNTFLDRFKDLGGDMPTEEENEAGIESLHSFGAYGIVESIAQRYHCKPYDVFQWGAEEVYMDMLYQQAKGRYQENLREIDKRKNK